MEILACERCHRIIDTYKRTNMLMPLSHHKYMLAGRQCICGHTVFVRRWTHEYVLKEKDNG
jgi:hypothetical protein